MNLKMTYCSFLIVTFVAIQFLNKDLQMKVYCVFEISKKLQSVFLRSPAILLLIW